MIYFTILKMKILCGHMDLLLKNNKLNKVSYKDKDVSTGFEGMKYFVKKRGLEKNHV